MSSQGLIIALASDHAGFELKTAVARQLEAAGHEVRDFGTKSTESVDFSDHVYPAALAVSEGRCARAILIDGAGYPSGIVANLLPNVYAAVCNDPLSVRYAREHSDCNVLTMGARVVGPGIAEQIVSIFLTTPFAGGKYAARVDKVRALAKKHRAGPELAPRKVVTLEDVREALARRESLILDASTVVTPSALDFDGR